MSKPPFCGNPSFPARTSFVEGRPPAWDGRPQQGQALPYLSGSSPLGGGSTSEYHSPAEHVTPTAAGQAGDGPGWAGRIPAASAGEHFSGHPVATFVTTAQRLLPFCIKQILKQNLPSVTLVVRRRQRWVGGSSAVSPLPSRPHVQENDGGEELRGEIMPSGVRMTPPPHTQPTLEEGAQSCICVSAFPRSELELECRLAEMGCGRMPAQPCTATCGQPETGLGSTPAGFPMSTLG